MDESHGLPHLQLPPCRQPPSKMALISGVCCTCKTYASRCDWHNSSRDGHPCPPCAFCTHKFCRECQVFTYTPYVVCWACGLETPLSTFTLHHGEDSQDWRCLRRADCRYPWDSSWRVVWKEEDRPGGKYRVKEEEVDLEEVERRRVREGWGLRRKVGVRGCLEILGEEEVGESGEVEDREGRQGQREGKVEEEDEEEDVEEEGKKRKVIGRLRTWIKR